MLSMNDLKRGRVISLNSQPYMVVSAQHIKMARSGATLRTKLKNLIDGGTLERSFSGGDKIEEADLARSPANFLYRDNDRYFFMDAASFEQYEFSDGDLEETKNYLKEGMAAEVLIYNGKAVSVELPKKVTLKVVSAPPGVRGDTSGSATKVATLETGVELRVPLFINTGDEIRVNTESGEYVERA